MKHESLEAFAENMKKYSLIKAINRQNEISCELHELRITIRRHIAAIDRITDPKYTPISVNNLEMLQKILAALNAEETKLMEEGDLLSEVIQAHRRNRS